MSPATAVVHCSARSLRAPVQRTYMTHMTRFGRRPVQLGTFLFSLRSQQKGEREEVLLQVAPFISFSARGSERDNWVR